VAARLVEWWGRSYSGADRVPPEPSLGATRGKGKRFFFLTIVHSINDMRKMALNVVWIQNCQTLKDSKLTLCLVPRSSSVFAAVYINASLPQPVFAAIYINASLPQPDMSTRDLSCLQKL
jgi:hypothetical protein